MTRGFAGRCGRFVLLAASVLLFARGALAQAPKKPGVWDRFTFDWGYELSWVRYTVIVDAYARDSATGREASAFAQIDYSTPKQGLACNAAFSIRPWLGLGLEGTASEYFGAPGAPAALDRVGVSFGRPRALGLSPFVEFRPRNRNYASRQGVFLRTGLQWLWVDHRFVHSPEVVVQWDGYQLQGTWWGGAGYRAALGAGVSIHAQAQVELSDGYAAAGLRIGGGFH